MELSQYFPTNNNPEISTLTVWEAHKPVIRGIFTKHGSRLEKAREFQSRKLLDEIHTLETAHKNLADDTSLTELTLLRERFKLLSLHTAKKQLQKCRKHFYFHGDKNGKSLARDLKTKQSQSYIPVIKTKRGDKTSLPGAIAETFRTYYEALYNLRTPHKTPHHGDSS